MKKKTIANTRRQFLKWTGGAGGTLLLQGLATGLPPAWLLNPTTAWAQDERQFETLILSNSGRGDPVNINCPGSYKPNANQNAYQNNPHLDFRRFNLGSHRVSAAAPWAELPNDLRRRLGFFHLKTFAAAHPEHRETMTLRSSVRSPQGNGSEMFASMVAQETTSGIQTIQAEPIVLGRDTVTYGGQPLQGSRPSELKELFRGDPNDLNNLRALRDQTIDRIYSDLRRNGTSKQRSFLERFARSATEARQLGGELDAWINREAADPDNPNSADDQVIAAVALAKARVAPVISIYIPFGGDNHQDSDLQIEAEQTRTGVATIGRLWQELKGARIQNRVTFAMLNVFGREFKRNATGGRNHNRNHGVMVAFGNRIKGGVYGGVGQNGACLNIRPNDGRGVVRGGISAEQTMVTAGKTIGAALGISANRLNERIQGGRILSAALRS